MKVSLLKDDVITNDKGGNLSYVHDVLGLKDMSELSQILTEFHFTPATFKENKRDKEHFEQLQLVHLDFDCGISPDEIIKKIHFHQYVVAGSKNHMKDKGDGKGIIPRFHVFIPLDSPLTDRYSYSEGWLRFVNSYGLNTSDSIGKDPCRYYYKHSSIIAVNNTGSPLSSYYFESCYQSKVLSEKYHGLSIQSQMKITRTPIARVELNAIEKFKRSKYMKLLESRMSCAGGRYNIANEIIGGMIKCGVSAGQGLELFQQYAAFYKDGLNAKNILKRFQEWS